MLDGQAPLSVAQLREYVQFLRLEHAIDSGGAAPRQTFHREPRQTSGRSASADRGHSSGSNGAHLIDDFRSRLSGVLRSGRGEDACEARAEIVDQALDLLDEGAHSSGGVASRRSLSPARIDDGRERIEDLVKLQRLRNRLSGAHYDQPAPSSRQSLSTARPSTGSQRLSVSSQRPSATRLSSSSALHEGSSSSALRHAQQPRQPSARANYTTVSITQRYTARPSMRGAPPQRPRARPGGVHERLAARPTGPSRSSIGSASRDGARSPRVHSAPSSPGRSRTGGPITVPWARPLPPPLDAQPSALSAGFESHGGMSASTNGVRTTSTRRGARRPKTAPSHKYMAPRSPRAAAGVEPSSNIRLIRLERENARLRALLAAHWIDASAAGPPPKRASQPPTLRMPSAAAARAGAARGEVDVVNLQAELAEATAVRRRQERHIQILTRELGDVALHAAQSINH
ncbi:hypothetical protein T492DRAFT_977348 [Pavlovales sp. CCMP2436]|nr:hypothetical protein T492DRAFT_977348 [Pavlovales sp. CCMP2436]